MLDFLKAIELLAEEKNLSKEVVLETVEAALAAAYRKDYGNPRQKVKLTIDQKSGKVDVFLLKEVVEEVKNEEAEMTLTEAKKYKKKSQIGDILEFPAMPPGEFGRIAAQTAKQVIIQRIREAERDMVFGEYKNKEGQLVNGIIQQIEGRNVIINLGKANGIMYPSEQVQSERYHVGQRFKVLIVSVDQTNRGPQIIVSRAHPDFIRHLFELEVPEIIAGSVVIKMLAREVGARTKMSVSASQEGVDPVGSCVGQRGTRVQSVLAELSDEKIDIILFDENLEKYIANALAPAKIERVVVNEAEKRAKVFVIENQLSLAIGKGGQNVRLAAKLVGYNIDVIKLTSEGAEEVQESASISHEDLEKIDGVSKVLAIHLREAGFDTIEKITNSTLEQLTDVKGVGKVLAERIMQGAQALLNPKEKKEEIVNIEEQKEEKIEEKSSTEQVE